MLAMMFSMAKQHQLADECNKKGDYNNIACDINLLVQENQQLAQGNVVNGAVED